MKKIFISTGILAIVFTLFAFTPSAGKLVSHNVHIKFFSTTPAEDIIANNSIAVSTINTETGDIVFSVPMQGFEFDYSLMQKHFNKKKYLNSKQFPKAKLKAKITNLQSIDFAKEGNYPVFIEGTMTVKGVSRTVQEQGTIIVKDDQVSVKSVFILTLADYGVTFEKSKKSANIADSVEVTVNAEYHLE